MQWGEFSSVQKSDWREYAPYQATFDDPGIIFFALSRVIYGALDQWGGLAWCAGVLASGEAGEVRQWFDGEAVGQIKTGYTDEMDMNPNVVGVWTRTARAGCYGGNYYVCLDSANQEFLFAYFGKKLRLFYVADMSMGRCDIYDNGVKVASLGQGPMPEAYSQFYELSPTKKGFHVVRVVRESGRINIDYVNVL